MIEARLAELGKKQAWLGQEVAAIEDRDNPYSQASVSGWLDTIEDKRPALLFNIEKALGVKPGHLTRHLGFVPVDTKPAKTVRELLQAEGFDEYAIDLIDGTVQNARRLRKTGNS
jgi:hypothetical protein